MDLVWWANKTGLWAGILGAFAALLALTSWVLTGWVSDAKDAELAAFREKAEREVAQLRAQSADREVKPSQRESLINAFKARKGALVIVSPMLNSEAHDFADEIDEAFRAAKWDTLRIRNWVGTGFGVSVGYPSGTSEPEILNMQRFAKQLTSLLELPVGVTMLAVGDASMSPHVQKDFAYLLVAQKPASKVE